MTLTPSSMLPNHVFRQYYPQIQLITAKRILLEKQAQQLEARLVEIRAELTLVLSKEQECNRHLDTIRPRPFFSRQLPDDVKLSIVGRVAVRDAATSTTQSTPIHGLLCSFCRSKLELTLTQTFAVVSVGHASVHSSRNAVVIG